MIDDVFAVIADPTRRQILNALATGKRAVGELVNELGVSQPTVSKHLKVLRQAGLVNTEAVGQKRFYSLTPEPLGEITRWIQQLQLALSHSAQTEPGKAVDSPGDHQAVTFTPLMPFTPSEDGKSPDEALLPAVDSHIPDAAQTGQQKPQLITLPGLPTAPEEPATTETRGLFATLTRWGRRRSR